jgi:lipid-A-disaccharide synthase
MRYFIIAGEASGDLHASNLVKELLKKDPEAVIEGWGGDLMQDAGVTIKKHYKELAFMGFWEVIKNIRTILSNIKLCKLHIEEFKPDAMIFIDYPGFNLRIAEHTKKRGIPNFYYISPQVWAWKEGRVKKMKQILDHLLVILPFEKKWYSERHQFEVTFVGHPLIDAIENFQKKALSKDSFLEKHSISNKPIIALLPGSRKQEITTKLPIMLQTVKHYPNFQFIIGGAPSLGNEFYEPLIAQTGVKIIYNDTYNLLNNATLALVTSGTATLETALFKVPQVVCYKGSSISYAIAKRLIKIKYISLVNLIADEPVVKELIQNDLTESNLIKALNDLLDESKHIQLLKKYDHLIELCGGIGASYNAANYVYNALKKHQNEEIIKK